MPIPLSTGTRAIQYVVFPLVTAGSVAAGTLSVISEPTVFNALFVMASLALLVVIGPYIYRMRDVYATDTGVRVRDAGELLEIPYAEIAAIRVFAHSNPKVVIVKLHCEHAFGDTLMFFSRRLFDSQARRWLSSADFLRERSRRLMAP